MFLKPGEIPTIWISGMDASSDRRGLFLADSHNKKVKYFVRDTETVCDLYSSNFTILNVRLLSADGSYLVTFECSETGFIFVL